MYKYKKHIILLLLILAIALPPYSTVDANAPDLKNAEYEDMIMKYNPQNNFNLEIDVNEASMDRADNHLNIPTYDGSGQCVHPSVKFFTEKWKGYHYWMAFTPYFDTNDDYENPSIIVSNDGINWKVPEGLNNPIVSPPEDNSHYSDPYLFFENDTLYLIYRLSDTTSVERILMRSSSDGVNWSDAVKLLDVPFTIERNLSPCLLKIDDKYVLYTVDVKQSPNVFKMRTASVLNGTWDTVENLNLFVSEKDMWHFEIIKYHNAFIMIMQTCILDSGSGKKGQLYLGVSKDGITWELSQNSIIESMDDIVWDRNIYKSSIQPRMDMDGLSFDIWYSANNANYSWFIGKSIIKFNKSKLLEDIETEVAKAELLIKPYIFRDTFNRSNSDTLGSNWTISRNFGVADNKAFVPVPDNNKAIVDVGISDYEVTVCFDKVTYGYHMWLIVRASDINNYIRCGYGPPYFMIQNVVNGSTSTISLLSSYEPKDGDYLTIKCIEDKLAMYINGVYWGSGLTAYNQTATCIGLQTSNVNNRYDNLMVKQIIFD